MLCMVDMHRQETNDSYGRLMQTLLGDAQENGAELVLESKVVGGDIEGEQLYLQFIPGEEAALHVHFSAPE